MKIFVPAVILAICIISSPALADRLTHKVARVSIEVPKGCKSAGDKVLTIGDPDDEVAVSFVVVDSGSIGRAAKAAGRQLAKTIKKLAIGKGEKITLNGMPGVKIEGTGRMEHKRVDLMILVLDTPAEDRDLMVIAIGESAKIGKHKRALRHVFDNIKPLKSHHHER
jgi:hypothetical protein